MYLKSLVLKGFKSFADRSVLSLEPGITAVVGPNGSGKSNVSDAVLWVLGERNAKNLRGQAMEDVIFAGSSARKPVGIAEVDLVLDNSDGTLPIEFNEVVLTRRMYRSGESEYLINGTIARRMDVLDILHDTGLGTGTHSIISQGSLDSILQSKPEDRRALIEEAAGVLKHKQRKAKSERKLEHMDQHLTRVKDVAAEVERQLGPLERKAKRALAYQELSGELSDLTLALAVDDLRTLQRSWDEAVLREATLNEELTQKKAFIAEAELHAEQLQEKIRQESTDAGELAKYHRRASSAVERFDGATLLLHEKRRAAQTYESELRVAMEGNKAKRSAAQSECSQSRTQMDEVRSAREQADADVTRLSAEHAQLTEQHRTLDKEVAVLTDERRTAERAQEKARRELVATQETLTSGLAHVKLIEGHGKELELQFSRAQTEAASLAGVCAQNEQALEALVASELAARQQVSDAFGARVAARSALDEARDVASTVAFEIKGLEEMDRAAAVAGPARAWLLEQAPQQAGDIQPLAHYLRAAEGSEALVESLLGEEVSALLVNNVADAASVASALVSSNEQGEVVLVAREGVEGDFSAHARAAAEAGLGRALVEELTYPASAARAIETLLGDVVVCESLQEAFSAHQASARAVRFVTPEGCVIWPNGKVTLGSVSAEHAEGVLARTRRLEKLREQLVGAEGARDEAEKTLQVAEEALRTAQSASLRLSQELAELRGKTDAARSDAKHSEEKLAAVRREFEDIERRRSEAANAVAEARPSVEALEQQLATLAQQLDEGSTRLAQLQDCVAPLRKQAAQVRDALAEAKLNAATLAERYRYAQRVVDARQREIDQIDAATIESRENLVRKMMAQKRIEPLLALMEELADSARRRTRTLEDAANEAQNASSGMHNAANEARSATRAAHDAFDEANARMGQARVDKGRLEVQVDAAVNTIVQDCKVPLDKALEISALDNRAATEDQAFKLRRRIANMGTINPDAADEYERLKTRFDYLAAQLADLDGARRALGKIVRVIDARMKDDFIRTFDAVNKNFTEIFAVLFPGGAAELTLVDPDDLENTGVEVTAQPRGKRITKMMLMSGGEKSLTALALLFAVYRIRTTPFYILDEVEAALDDSNLRRLTAYLDTLRNATQLIMITHQRRTMEMADVLFGVSMQADGVTKVVSQKLEHALAHAE